MSLRYKTVSMVASLLLFAVLGLFVLGPKVHAGGAVGGGGNPSGGAGSYWTSNGYGWYSYDANSGSGPEAWSQGGPWSTVRSTCLNAGADRVVAFIVQRAGGNNSGNNAKVYQYNTNIFRPGWYGYKGNNGGNWLTVGTANALFNSLDPSVRAGYTFGSNVAWFCYSNNPPWSVTVTSSADKTIVEPGERITWTHSIVNNGPNITNRSITWRYQNTGDWPNTNGPAWTLASGHRVGEAGRVTNTSQYEAQTSDVGRRICRVTTATPSTHNGGTTTSNPTCVTVAKKPKVQITGSDLIIGRTFAGASVISGTSTSVTDKVVSPGVTPPFNANMIVGLWPTGVSSNGTKLPAGSADPHWQLTNVYSANANGRTLQPAASDAHWTSTNSESTCQPGPYPRAATVVNTNLVSVGANEAWKASLPNSAWIGAYEDANNIGNSGSCVYPGMSETINQTTYAKAAIWVFTLTNGFTIDPCVDPASIRLNFNLSADDEVQVLVNGQTVAQPENFRHYGQWPSTPVSYTTGTSSAFRTGNNTLEIRLKSAWQYTGLLLNSISVASAQCKPVVPGNVFGSWIEYGIFATGVINGTGSGAAFAGTGGKSSQKCEYSSLSFVNATTSNPSSACSTTTNIGGYTTGRGIPDVAANFPVVKNQPTGNTPVFDNAAARPQGLFTSNDHGNPVVSDPITVGTPGTAKTIAKGQWVVINAPDADVTIAGDIIYEGDDLRSLADIPQMVIIAKNIYINPDVRQVDAWLIAKGTTAGTGVLDTCRISTSYATQLTTNLCADKLTVNGPVMARSLWLRRTAGSGAGAQSGDPAEVFNLRPDAYLWGFARASTAGSVQTVYTSELPPRF